MSKIGFIGLGDMGQVIVPRLLEAGHTVTGWNRSPGKSKSLEDAGMMIASTPAEAAKNADIVLSIVTDGNAVKDVSLGENGIITSLNKEAIYLDMSTISPEVSRFVSEEFDKRGLQMMDAPLSGSPVTVLQGSASIMVAGKKECYEKVYDTLLAIGPKVSYIGSNGLAVQTKLSINLLLMVEVIAFGEAVAMAEKGGVDRQVVVDAILNSVATSPVLSYRGPFILDGKMPEKPLADVALQQKDMTLVLEQSRLLASPAPLAAAANDMMNASRGMGLGHHDFVVAHRAYKKMNGGE
ncbi:MAG: NAD(P)-dependent oxidoreductase [Rhizobiales bacterium]|nr:NAD(P)-dependent oxidoreductase [Hyphomicrobiales bacterium]MBL6770745.1 NAD(P)-dependent oxidoreductase [Hyphomicrobiales bacterium]